MLKLKRDSNIIYDLGKLKTNIVTNILKKKRFEISIQNMMILTEYNFYNIFL